MIDARQRLMERFPEKRDAIGLLDTDPRFDALCEEYMSISRQLEELTQQESTNASARVGILQARCIGLEEELVTAIEGYRPD
jgi:hypothetical protein